MNRAPFIFVMFILATLGCAERGPKPPSVAELTEMIQKDEPDTQQKGIAWVAQLGPKAAATRPALVAALKSSNAKVRQNSAIALSRIGPEAAEAIPALTGALTDPEMDVRRAAADTLGQLGPAAASAIPALERMSAEPDQCNSAKNALKKIRS